MTEEGDVIEALYKQGDDRFALGLLSDRAYAREVTAFLLARRPKASACKLVANTAKHASEDAVQFAFWSLTRLGKKCHPQMRALAKNASQPLVVRGMAAEVLAMMRDDTALSVAKDSKDSLFRAALQRAEIIYAAPE